MFTIHKDEIDAMIALCVGKPDLRLDEQQLNFRGAKVPVCLP